MPCMCFAIASLLMLCRRSVVLPTGQEEGCPYSFVKGFFELNLGVERGFQQSRPAICSPTAAGDTTVGTSSSARCSSHSPSRPSRPSGRAAVPASIQSCSCEAAWGAYSLLALDCGDGATKQCGRGGFRRNCIVNPCRSRICQLMVTLTLVNAVAILFQISHMF